MSRAAHALGILLAAAFAACAGNAPSHGAAEGSGAEATEEGRAPQAAERAPLETAPTERAQPVAAPSDAASSGAVSGAPGSDPGAAGPAQPGAGGPSAAELALSEAEARWRADPDSEQACVWVGRRLGYLGRYEEAVATFTKGLERHPESAWLLRFRGHRWITLRRFDRAVRDLERARVLAARAPDEVEPDGQPNAAGIPIGTLRSNVDYHLGLALRLAGELERAAEVYRDGFERARANPDRLVSHTYWTWLTLRELRREGEALALLAPIHPGLAVVENDGYLALLLHFRGELSRADLLEGLEPGTTEHATRGYGAAMKLRFEGDAAASRELLELVAARGPQASFGCISAQAELARR